MDIQYWKNYYKSHKHNTTNSLFSAFVRENYLKPHARLLELGCGNGRDSVYFAKSAIDTTAIDQIQDEMNYLNDHFGNEACRFVCGDFSQLKHINSLHPPYDCIYSRFSLHSITYIQQCELFAQIPSYLDCDGILAIETRGVQNSLYQKGERVQDEENAFIYESHYRRFVTLEDLLEDIRAMNSDSRSFQILYAKESRGFAPFTQGDRYEDDYFIRVIARLTDSCSGGGANKYIVIILFPKKTYTHHSYPFIATKCAYAHEGKEAV